MKYRTARGVETDQRPYKDLDQDEREQILEDDMKMAPREVRAKWNISSQTLHHLRYHNKEAIQEIEDRHFAEHGL